MSARDAYPCHVEYSTLAKVGIDSEPKLGPQDSFSDSGPTAASRMDHVAEVFALAAHGGELVDPERDEDVAKPMSA